MANVLGDTLIRRLRKEKGMTQAQLCEGICTKGTLSNIENGKRPPNRWVFKQLMERLGENSSRYFMDVVTLDDRSLAETKDRLRGLLRKNSSESNEAAYALMGELDRDKNFSTKENRQFLLRSKASLAFNLKKHEDARAYVLEALRVTRPNFDEGKIGTYALSLDEVFLTNQLAVVYFLEGCIEKSTDVFLAVKEAVDGNYIESDEMIGIYSDLLYNLSKNFGLLGKNQDCIDICDIGMQWCQNHRRFFQYPRFLYNKAYLLIYLGRKEEGIKLLEKAFALFWGFGRYAELSFIQNSIQEKFGIKIDNLAMTSL